jgi:hypothetical protein
MNLSSKDWITEDKKLHDSRYDAIRKTNIHINKWMLRLIINY